MSCEKDHNPELDILAKLAGINASPAVFRIISELLIMQVAPEEIYRLLRSISPLSLRTHDQAMKPSVSSR
ncbi:hypothetical protein HCN44_007481 [Aphidius gifuensis]|uniref:Uncharacterized protein n=1 Tax=Aphidius gifuensis TaxID=684658 RepID=A0A834XLZ9_APHGI|nr:hypothetical protein HCN44_007481 [Aphidius gifuensis]